MNSYKRSKNHIRRCELAKIRWINVSVPQVCSYQLFLLRKQKFPRRFIVRKSYQHRRFDGLKKKNTPKPCTKKYRWTRTPNEANFETNGSKIKNESWKQRERQKMRRKISICFRYLRSETVILKRNYCKNENRSSLREDFVKPRNLTISVKIYDSLESLSSALKLNVPYLRDESFKWKKM